MYYYGARYLDPKYSLWISADPAMNSGEYFPVAPTNDEAKKHNSNLPGMGGVYNTINFHLYHYAGNNPVKYTDPDGRDDEFPILDETKVPSECVHARSIAAYNDLTAKGCPYPYKNEVSRYFNIEDFAIFQSEIVDECRKLEKESDVYRMHQFVSKISLSKKISNKVSLFLKSQLTNTKFEFIVNGGCKINETLSYVDKFFTNFEKAANIVSTKDVLAKSYKTLQNKVTDFKDKLKSEINGGYTLSVIKVDLLKDNQNNIIDIQMSAIIYKKREIKFINSED